MAKPLELNWVPAGAGRLALAHRPGYTELHRLPQLGVTHVVTLLSENEQAPRLGQRVKSLGLRWTWLPLNNGRYPRGEAQELLATALPVLSSDLDAGDAILIHCAAGIHRTGMLAYGLLRWRGLGPAEALDLIGRMRAHTRAGMLPRHIRWGEDILAGRPAPPPEAEDDLPEDEGQSDDA